MRRLSAAVLLVLAGGAQAQEGTALDGAAIAATLTDQWVRYDNGARQHFYGSGRTQYFHGQPSWGYWRVEGSRYCSQWPPQPNWDCYDLHRLPDGGITFLDDWGNDFPGVVEGE